MKIFVHAKPRAKNEEVIKIDDLHFIVFVTVPPVKGMANEAIARALADYFQVSRSHVQLVSGFLSREKVFEVLHL